MRPLALRAVLVATDLDDAMLPALRTAIELARLADARLYLVHATEAPVDDAQRALADHLRRAGAGPEILADARVERGPADRVIGEAALSTAADVIVLGPHRPDRPSGLGSTAVRVVHQAEVPCLILPVALPLPLGTVLAPVDVSDARRDALRGILAVSLTWTSALRRRPGTGSPTRLLVLHVATSGEDGASPAGLEVLASEVADVRESLGAVAGVDVRPAVEHDDHPAASILRRAETEGADLLVLATRGVHAADPAQLGSVSAGVVRSTTRPVLLVPPAVWRDRDGSLPGEARPG